MTLVLDKPVYDSIISQADVESSSLLDLKAGPKINIPKHDCNLVWAKPQ